jgi:hypothetical protein
MSQTDRRIVAAAADLRSPAGEMCSLRSTPSRRRFGAAAESDVRDVKPAVCSIDGVHLGNVLALWPTVAGGLGLGACAITELVPEGVETAPEAGAAAVGLEEVAISCDAENEQGCACLPEQPKGKTLHAPRDHGGTAPCLLLTQALC